MKHCAATAGVLDDVLLQPTACSFDRAWLQCPAGAADTSQCLTAEEVAVVEDLYKGPRDEAGRHFEIHGFAIGSEHRWALSTAEQVANPEAKEGHQLRRFMLPPEGNKSDTELEDAFRFNQEWFDKTRATAPLFNAGNTNLRPYADHGGKLILWHGAQDNAVQPEASVAYYQGVQKVLGTSRTDSFMRLFVIPGIAHCGGGDLAFQLNVLSPLMAWTELHRAPDMIVAGKPAASQSDAETQGGQNTAGRAQGTGGAWGWHTPLATPSRPNAFTRPVYPFPYMASYSGKGDPNDAASYRPVRSGAPVPQVFDTEAARLFGPRTQLFYHIESGQLVPDRKQGAKR